MNNKFRTLLAFSAIGLSGAALPLTGTELEPFRVSVPFAFTSGKTNLPAGDYTVIEEDSRVIMIRGSHGSVMVLAASVDGSVNEKAGVSFRHTGNGYILQSVHAWGKPSSMVPVMTAASPR